MATKKRRVAIWVFRKPSKTSVSPSLKAAIMMSQRYDIPLIYEPAQWDGRSLDTLFIMNGAYAFCKALPFLAELVLTSKNIVWGQNDYVIIPPGVQSKAVSPFRAAFRKRREQGLPGIRYWTTVLPRGEESGNTYVNWNALSYRPVQHDSEMTVRNRLFYFGYWRKNREVAFNRFFKAPEYRVAISTGSVEQFRERYHHKAIRYIEPLPTHGIPEALSTKGVGLYLEDARSHREFHSPATRFYEMLSAGMPMLFQKESAPMLGKAGFDISPYIVETPVEVARALRKRGVIRKQQHDAWGRRDYRKETIRQLDKLVKDL